MIDGADVVHLKEITAENFISTITSNIFSTTMCFWSLEWPLFSRLNTKYMTLYCDNKKSLFRSANQIKVISHLYLTTDGNKSQISQKKHPWLTLTGNDESQTACFGLGKVVYAYRSREEDEKVDNRGKDVR